MQISWQVDPSDIGSIHHLMAKMADNVFVRERIVRNVEGGTRSKLTKSSFWHTLNMCLLTTQQRSGPTSPVTRFLATDPFPTSLGRCLTAEDLQSFAEGQISGFGGLRRASTIAKALAKNFEYLENEGWLHILPLVKTLENTHTRNDERSVARSLSSALSGIGPKQSRNLLQALGLTQHEIPLDSRIVKWLNAHGFPIHLSAAGLADHNYYEFIMDGIQELCTAAGLLPCVFDAMVFASFDKDEWKPGSVF